MSFISNQSKRLDLEIVQGKTLRPTLRWEKDPLISKPITGISRGTPARITVVGHGLTDGWNVVPVGVKGMTQVNAENFPPKERDFTRCTVVDVDHVDLDNVSSAEFGAYTSGGSLVFHTPASLSGCTALLVVRDEVGGNELVRLTEISGIDLDDTAKTITPTFDALDTAEYSWDEGVYELEIHDAGVVTGLFHGNVTVIKEVAT